MMLGEGEVRQAVDVLWETGCQRLSQTPHDNMQQATARAPNLEIQMDQQMENPNHPRNDRGGPACFA